MNVQVKIALLGKESDGKAINLNVQNSLGCLSVKGYRESKGATLAQRSPVSIWHRNGWFIPEPYFRYIMREAASETGNREFKSGPLTIKVDISEDNHPNKGRFGLFVRREDEEYHIDQDTNQEIEQRLDQTASLMYAYEIPCSSPDFATGLSVKAMMGLEEGQPFRKVCLYIGERYITKRSIEHILRLIERTEQSPVKEPLRSGP